MNELLNRYRRSINPPHKWKDYLNLTLTFLLLLALPITIYFVSNQQQKQELRGRAQQEVQKSASQEAKDLTLEAIKVKRAGDEGKAKASIQKRKEAMLKLMEEDPEEVLRIALPSNIRSEFPEDVQNDIEQEVELEGTLEILHGHNVVRKTSKDDYSILTDDKKRISLYFADKEPGLIPQAKIKVKGVKLEDKIVIQTTNDENFKILQQQSNVLQAAIPTFKKVAVILFNFSDAVSEPITSETARAVIFTNSDSTAEYYRETSFNKLILEGKLRVEGDVFGWYTINANHGSCLLSYYTFWSNLAEEAASRDGFSREGYNNIIYVFPVNNACPGQSGYYSYVEINGDQSWITLRDSRDFTHSIVSHQLGHNFNLHHAGVLYCTDATGRKVAISNTCQYSGTYNQITLDGGDKFSVMGYYGSNQLNNVHKAKLNYTNSSNIRTLTQGESGTYTLFPIEQPQLGIQTLKIPAPDIFGEVSPNSYYYLEYRRPFGVFDSFNNTDPVVNGISIRKATDTAAVGNYNYQFSHLLDTTPGSLGNGLNDWDDGALAVGREFYDPVAGVAIKTLSVDSEKATVQVTFGQQVCTRANPTVTIDPTGSYGNPGQALSYSLIVKNNDSSICPLTQFNVTTTLPGSEWSQNLASPHYLDLNPGQSISYSNSITSPSNAALGFYPFTVTMTNTVAPSYTASVTANYNISGSIAIPTPTPTPILIPTGNIGVGRTTPSPTLAIITPTPTGNIGVGRTAPTPTLAITTPTPTGTQAPANPTSTPPPPLQTPSCGSSWVCINNVTGNSCVTSSGSIDSCPIGDCDCSGPGTITQCVDSGIDCGTRYGLSGLIFFDTNRNGIYDSATGETYYNKASTTMQLTKPDGSTVSAGVQSMYFFGDLTQTGTYTLTLTVPQGYQATTPNPASVTITPSGATSPYFGLVDLTQGPELYSQQLTCPSLTQVTLNGQLQYRFTNWTVQVANGGLKPANAQAAVNQLSIGELSVNQQFPIGTLNPDQSVTHTLDLSNVRGVRYNAPYTFSLRIDRFSNIAEANEQNNQVSITCRAR